MLRKILRRALRLVNDFGMVGMPRQMWVEGNGGKSLLIIAPGEILMPVFGWGAVETIISETIPTYIKAGFSVQVLNSKHPKDWKSVAKGNYDVVLCHSDVLSSRALKYFHDTPIIGVCHYGFAAFPNRWHRGFKKIINDLSKLDYVACLNNQILEVFCEYIDPEKLFISSNGSDMRIQRSELETRKNKFVYIGKVEKRKMQFEVFNNFRASGIQIDFIGNISDQRVSELVSRDSAAFKQFKGPMTRLQIIDALPDYDGLLLFSQGEADALVLYEAQLAGLPIFITEEAKGAQEINLPWVVLISQNVTPADLVKLRNNIQVTNSTIRNFAESNFNWEKRNFSLVSKILELSKLKERL
jgi:glycosyltransferase involved in cell wall biosynthesis